MHPSPAFLSHPSRTAAARLPESCGRPPALPSSFQAKSTETRSRLRIRQLFAEIGTNADDSTYRLAMDVLKGKYAWMEEGAILEHDAGPDAPPSPGAGAAGTPANRAPISGSRATEQVGA